MKVSMVSLSICFVWLSSIGSCRAFSLLSQSPSIRPSMLSRKSSISDEPVASSTADQQQNQHHLNKIVSSSTNFQSSQIRLPDQQHLSENPSLLADSLADLLREWEPPSTPAIAFLFVSELELKLLESTVTLAKARLGSQTTLVTVVGGGSVGPASEQANVSFLGGVLPPEATVDVVVKSNIDETPQKLPTTSDVHSALLFADPHFSDMHSELDKWSEQGLLVAGGISVAEPGQSSLAYNDQVLPPGSLLGVRFGGTLGLSVVTSHGCRPIGPTYKVTQVEGPVLSELNGVSALEQLNVAIQEGGSEAQMLVHENGVLGGIHRAEDEDEEASWDISRQLLAADGIDHPVEQKETTTEQEITRVEKHRDFCLREITGFRPRSGSILVCGPQIKNGDNFRFHVRSKETAMEDWKFVLKRAQTEKIFMGERAGAQVAALQISCMARGPGLFETLDVDLKHTKKLVDDDSIPIAGMMANAEIAPVGIHMGKMAFEASPPKSYLQGFASVVVTLCDFTQASRPDEDVLLTTCLGNSTDMENAWE